MEKNLLEFTREELEAIEDRAILDAIASAVGAEQTKRADHLIGRILDRIASLSESGAEPVFLAKESEPSQAEPSAVTPAAEETAVEKVDPVTFRTKSGQCHMVGDKVLLPEVTLDDPSEIEFYERFLNLVERV